MINNINLLRTFPKEPIPDYISHGEGVNLFTQSGHKYLDFTSGATQCAVLGYSNKDVIDAIHKQADKICYIDYKAWSDPNRDELASLLLSRAKHGLNRVFFTGQSGSEACEAAMKLSYQAHYDQGNRKKTWFISRKQGYHGATLDSLSLGDRPNLDFFKNILPEKRAKIPQHHPLYCKLEGENLDEYAVRSARDLEDKILELGPENVCAFVGETIMGGLVGDVPPAPNYWIYIRAICDKYNVHLILDEVYCGTGASGKIYCCDWDNVKPDFILLGKTLGAGYMPLSAVVTSDSIEQSIINGQGRIGYSSTHQGHTLSVATALAVQKIIHTDEMLDHINQTGEFFRNELRAQLGSHPFFFNVRGRGLRFSLEYRCRNQNEFGPKIQEVMQKEHNILINGKWHRISFTPPFIITKDEAELVLDKFIKTFKSVAKNWN